jgi:hypothetical protein
MKKGKKERKVMKGEERNESIEGKMKRNAKK